MIIDLLIDFVLDTLPDKLRAFVTALVRAVFFFLEDSWWGKFFLRPLMLTLPAIILTVGQLVKNVGDVFNAHPWLTWCVAALPFVIELGLSLLRERIGLPKLTNQGYYDLMSIIDRDIVGSKMNRFGEKAKEVANRKKGQHRLTCTEIFKEITQPEQQFQVISRAIFDYFMSTMRQDSVDLEVFIVETDDTKPIARLAFYPKNHVPMPVEKLQPDASAFCTALRIKQMHIIPDTEKEAGKARPGYLKIDGDYNGPSSMICYPIKHGELDRYVMAVAIRAKKTDVFRVSDRVQYQYVMEVFERRLLIEYSLLRLRREASDGHE
jgi:hypothetical protein